MSKLKNISIWGILQWYFNILFVVITCSFIYLGCAENNTITNEAFINNIKYKENLNFIYIKINKKDYICVRDLYQIKMSKVIRQKSFNYFYIFYIKIGKYYKKQFDSYFFESEKEAHEWLNKLFKTNE